MKKIVKLLKKIILFVFLLFSLSFAFVWNAFAVTENQSITPKQHFHYARNAYRKTFIQYKYVKVYKNNQSTYIKVKVRKSGLCKLYLQEISQSRKKCLVIYNDLLITKQKLQVPHLSHSSTESKLNRVNQNLRNLESTLQKVDKLKYVRNSQELNLKIRQIKVTLNEMQNTISEDFLFFNNQYTKIRELHEVCSDFYNSLYSLISFKVTFPAMNAGIPGPNGQIARIHVRPNIDEIAIGNKRFINVNFYVAKSHEILTNLNDFGIGQGNRFYDDIVKYCEVMGDEEYQPLARLCTFQKYSDTLLNFAAAQVGNSSGPEIRYFSSAQIRGNSCANSFGIVTNAKCYLTFQDIGYFGRHFAVSQICPGFD